MVNTSRIEPSTQKIGLQPRFVPMAGGRSQQVVAALCYTLAVLALFVLTVEADVTPLDRDSPLEELPHSDHNFHSGDDQRAESELAEAESLYNFLSDMYPTAKRTSEEAKSELGETQLGGQEVGGGRLFGGSRMHLMKKKMRISAHKRARRRRTRTRRFRHAMQNHRPNKPGTGSCPAFKCQPSDFKLVKKKRFVLGRYKSCKKECKTFKRKKTCTDKCSWRPGCHRAVLVAKFFKCKDEMRMTTTPFAKMLHGPRRTTKSRRSRSKEDNSELGETQLGGQEVGGGRLFGRNSMFMKKIRMARMRSKRRMTRARLSFSPSSHKMKCPSCTCKSNKGWHMGQRCQGPGCTVACASVKDESYFGCMQQYIKTVSDFYSKSVNPVATEPSPSSKRKATTKSSSKRKRWFKKLSQKDSSKSRKKKKPSAFAAVRRAVARMDPTAAQKAQTGKSRKHNQGKSLRRRRRRHRRNQGRRRASTKHQRARRSKKDSKRFSLFAKRSAKRRSHAGSRKATQPTKGGISCIAHHGTVADCSRDSKVVKAAIKLVKKAGHKVSNKMLGSSRECETTHGELADCSTRAHSKNAEEATHTELCEVYCAGITSHDLGESIQQAMESTASKQCIRQCQASRHDLGESGESRARFIRGIARGAKNIVKKIWKKVVNKIKAGAVAFFSPVKRWVQKSINRYKCVVGTVYDLNQDTKDTCKPFKLGGTEKYQELANQILTDLIYAMLAKVFHNWISAALKKLNLDKYFSMLRKFPLKPLVPALVKYNSLCGNGAFAKMTVDDILWQGYGQNEWSNKDGVKCGCGPNQSACARRCRARLKTRQMTSKQSTGGRPDFQTQLMV